MAYSLKRVASLYSIRKDVSPKIFSFIKDRKINTSDLDSLIAYTRKISSKEHFYCDLEIYTCDSPYQPTQEELSMEYVKVGHPNSELLEWDVDKFRNHVLSQMATDEYSYHSYKYYYSDSIEYLNIRFDNPKTSRTIVIGIDHADNPSEISYFVDGETKQFIW